MEHATATSSAHQHYISAIAGNPLHDVSLSKKSEEYPRMHVSRAKQILNSLRNFTSARVTPTASPNRTISNGVVCGIPRSCCRYNSPQRQGMISSPLLSRLSKMAAKASSFAALETDGKLAFRRKTEANWNKMARITVDMGPHKGDQLSLVSDLSDKLL